MKVLGLVASPRKLGNSEIIVKEMLKSLPDDWDKKMIGLNDLRIDRCRACYACLPQGKNCILPDDLNFFLAHIREADKVIIAAPVYYLGQHTILKLINDRMIAIQNDSREYFKNKQCVIVTPHAVKDWEGYGREATMHFARFLGLNVTGTLVVNKTLPGDVLDEDSLIKIRELAMSLVDNSTVDFRDPALAYCPECDSSLLQIRRNGCWRCVMCGSVGGWKVKDGEFLLSVSPAELKRFSREGMEEHGHILTEIKEEYIRRRKEVAANQSLYKDIDYWTKP
jgi:NAD(P)H-dependent FMN reductase/ribosomal protein L37AE/L43A